MPKKARELLEKTYRSCLTLAVQLDIPRIAFPTIGCGAIAFDTADVAKIVYHLLAKFDFPKGKKLNQVRIIIYDMNVYHPFTSTFITLGQERGAQVKFDTMYESFSQLLRFLYSSIADLCLYPDSSLSNFVSFRLDSSTTSSGMASRGETQ